MRGPNSARRSPSRFRSNPQGISKRFIRTYGIFTDLLLKAPRSTFEERGAFAIVRTPSNPGYYFGNYLICDRAPQPGEAETWIQEFEAAFANDPRVRHAAFAFPGVTNVAEEFTRIGFTVARHSVMTSQNIVPIGPPAGVEMRLLHSQDDWAAQLELQLATRPKVLDESEYRRFKQLEIAHQRNLVDEMGAWIGAFEGPRLIGSCGIFHVTEDLARYQDVAVHQVFRNRGVGRALVSAAGTLALESFEAKTLVIAADTDDFPRRIYEKSGFREEHRETHMWKAQR